MVTSLDSILATYDENTLVYANDQLKQVTIVSDTSNTWTIYWDGSFDGNKAGVGIWLSRGTDYIKISCPVWATDATRCESLGPALASLLLARLGKCTV